MNTTREIRVRRENVNGIIISLIAAGFEAALSGNRPSASYLGGCIDPGCCQPHPEAICHWAEGGEYGIAVMPEDWVLIETSASGRQAHQVIETWKNEGISLTKAALVRSKIMAHNMCHDCPELYRGEHTGELLCFKRWTPLAHAPRPYGDGQLTNVMCDMAYPDNSPSDLEVAMATCAERYARGEKCYILMKGSEDVLEIVSPERETGRHERAYYPSLRFLE